jgi:hypothetical protein
MIKIGQWAMRREILMQPIQGVRYFNRRFPKLGIEPLALSELFRRVPPAHFDHPQRPAFHLLMLFSSGATTHFLDFERLRCTAGTLLHVRPGQVQQFVPGADVEARSFSLRPSLFCRMRRRAIRWSGARRSIMRRQVERSTSMRIHTGEFAPGVPR